MNPSRPHRSVRQSFRHPRFLEALLHYIYGRKPECDLSRLKLKFSRTGKPRYVLLDGERVFTIKPNDFSLTFSALGAKMLERCFPGRTARVFVSEPPERSVFAKHVLDADEAIRRGVDVLVIYEGSLVAFGKALMSGREMKSLNLGEAVRLRGKIE